MQQRRRMALQLSNVIPGQSDSWTAELDAWRIPGLFPGSCRFPFTMRGTAREAQEI